MKPRLKICVVTGSRAEFGLLYFLMKRIQGDSDTELQLVVTGTHLSEAFGNTQHDIESSGFDIQERVDILTENDSYAGTVQALAKGVVGFSEAFGRLNPDLICLLGDRYEIFAAAQAALIGKIPVAHLAGGDTTEGAFDESLRHSITKMSHFHFVTNAIAEQRLWQLGENPDSVFNVGYTGIDQIKNMQALSRKEVEKALNFQLAKKNILVTFHPTTLDLVPSTHQFQELLTALSGLGDDTAIIFTKPNADPEGRQLIRMTEQFVEQHPRSIVSASLGQRLYLNLMNMVNVVVGNSSSGLYEAPSFQVPTVNIGNRQKGRLRATSVIDCDPVATAISKAIQEAFKRDCSLTQSPYGDGESSDRIFAIMKAIVSPRNYLQKRFHLMRTGASSTPVYVVAEAGVNHNGSLELAKQLIDAAADAGADAIKFQTFKASSLAAKDAPKALYQLQTTDQGESQLEMLKKLELDHASHRKLLEYTRRKKIHFLSTPFDAESVEFLAHDLKLRCLKVPSGEITNAPLLLKIARTKLPLIISTGMATLPEIEDALGIIAFGWTALPNVAPSRQKCREAFLSQAGKNRLRREVTLLQCTTDYPAEPHDINLLTMDSLKHKFGVRVGLSDHSCGITASIAAAARGASVIEKHITLDRNLPGPDHQASLEPSEFGEMIRMIREVEKILGTSIKAPTSNELKNRFVARRGIIAREPIRRGESFTETNVAVKRPATGMSPMLFWEVIGTTAERAYKSNEVVRS